MLEGCKRYALIYDWSPMYEYVYIYYPPVDEIRSVAMHCMRTTA